MRRFVISLTLVLAVCSAGFATVYNFEGYDVDVDAWVGSGSSETILVVDWNKADNGLLTVHESHAFGYRWNGSKSFYEMLMDFDSANVFDVKWTSYLLNITYFDGAETHSHLEEGSWNGASSSNPNGYWGTWGDPSTQWDYNQGAMDVEMLVDGQFEGLNAVFYFATPEDYVDDQLDVPIVPEPCSICLMCLGTFLIRRKMHC